MKSTPMCPYCGTKPEWLPDSRVYQKSYGGYVYVCFRCDAFVGCHKQGDHTKAKGTLANKELRQLRVRAHELFDGMWRKVAQSRKWSKSRARRAAYLWLASEMGIPKDKVNQLCHIGMFREEETKRVIAICEAVYSKAARNKSVTIVATGENCNGISQTCQ